MGEIKKIKAREILDSKGDPTVEVDLITEKGKSSASVSSGVSKGKYEALELRDGGVRYGGMGVLKAVENINQITAPKLIGRDPSNQREIDQFLCELDGTENKSKLGANAILPISVAVCRAGAKAKNLPLYKHISQLSPPTFSRALRKTGQLLSPCILLVEGGLHAGNKLSVQEFMIVPTANSFSERLRMGTEIYHTLGKILRQKYSTFSTNVGLEGGFAAPLFLSSEVLDLIMAAVEKAGYKNEVGIILDMAATHFFKGESYEFEGATFTRKGMMNFYEEIVNRYPILGIEDPFDQEDWEGWQKLKSRIKDVSPGSTAVQQKSELLIIGDDLTVTNKERIKKAIKEDCANAVVIKPNQIGTVTETLEAARLAQKAGWEVFVKHRSGETDDTFIADLAVGIGARYIMAGAPNRGERVAKYNRLLRIEQRLKS